MVKIEKQNRIRIVFLIIAVLLTSFAANAQAASLAFEIEVNNNASFEKVTYLPEVAHRKSQAQIDAELAEKKRKELVIKVTQEKMRTDFTQVYVSASKRFGIDWQILAAVHSVETGQRGNTSITSYAGAQGPMQFIPSTFRAYAVDGDGDGRALIYDVDDAIFSAANYLSANLRVKGTIDGALYQYNHSWSYVAKVKSIASTLY